MRIENIEIMGLENAVKASKYPMAVDTTNTTTEITKTVEKLAKAKIGSGHDNFLNGIVISFDIFGTNKWWTEMQRYHFIDFVSAQSTMHRISKFNLDESYIKYVDENIISIMKSKIENYNKTEDFIKDCKERIEKINSLDMDEAQLLELENIKKEISIVTESQKEKYLEILYSNPSGFILGARLVTNYRQLKTIYAQRKNHRLPEWREFCEWIKTLPHSDWITGDE